MSSTSSGKERYQLAIHATDLPNIHRRWCSTTPFRKVINPYAEVKIKSGSSSSSTTKKEISLGQTEVMYATQDPDFVKLFLIEFTPRGHEILYISISIMDYFLGKEPTCIGTVKFEATSVYESPNKTKSAQLDGSSGKVYCHIEKSLLGDETGNLRLKLRGLDMKNVEPGAFGLGRSDPFFEIAKKDSDYMAGHENWNVVYRSKYIDDNLNPYWEDFELSLEELCYGKLDWPLKITIWDHNKSGKHVKIGEIAETKISELQNQIAVKGNADREKAIPITRPEKNFKTYGLICILQAELRPTTSTGV